MSLSFVWEVSDRGKRPVEEATNDGRNLHAVRLQREMASVKETDLGARDVARERLGSRGQEERVVLAPRCQKWRLMLSEVGLEGRVESDVTGIVEEEIELRLMRSRARQIMVIQ
jgi:hypothetical protein